MDSHIFFLYNRDVYDEHLKMCSHMAINYLIFLFDLIIHCVKSPF